jgi:hypothetical protein
MGGVFGGLDKMGRGLEGKEVEEVVLYQKPRDAGAGGVT